MEVACLVMPDSTPKENGSGRTWTYCDKYSLLWPLKANKVEVFECKEKKREDKNNKKKTKMATQGVFW